MRILPIALLAAFFIAAPANASTPDLSTLQPPAGNVVYDAGYATGVQIYTCNNGAWTLKAPRATLVNFLGKPTWTHFGGPTWQHKDGSSVVGAANAVVPVSPTAIPWLRVKAVSTARGPHGADTMLKTTYIQRLATTGGLAPAASTCTTAGALQEVPYTALYVFWKKA